MLITARRGMGGAGKTMLAQALCYDGAVREALPDGIARSDGRQGAGLSARHPKSGVVARPGRRAWHERVGVFSDIDRWSARTNEGKAALVIVENVWRTEDVEPSSSPTRPRSRLVVHDAPQCDCRRHRDRRHQVWLLTLMESRELLARWAGVAADALLLESSTIIDECERPPLALSMTGATLRGKLMFTGTGAEAVAASGREKISRKLRVRTAVSMWARGRASASTR